MSNSNEPYIAFDLDGTLARDDEDVKTMYGIGSPVGPMVKLVQGYLADGWVVKVMTARANIALYDSEEQRDKGIDKVKAWCSRYIGLELEVTCCKDHRMVVLYDDRGVSVERNTGQIIKAEVQFLGKKYRQKST